MTDAPTPDPSREGLLRTLAALQDTLNRIAIGEVGGEPADDFRAALQIRREAEAIEAAATRRARDANVSWTELGRLQETSKQNARQRGERLLDRGLDQGLEL